MSEALGIPAGALRAIWVFAIDLPKEALKPFANEERSDHGELSHWPLRDALGLDYLDPEFIEVFEAETLREIGFSKYLTDANGMDAKTVAPDAAQLDALKGPVLLVYSRALADRQVALAPQKPLRLIGRYTERGSVTLRTAPHTEAAKPSANAAPAAEAKQSPKRVGLYVLAAGILTALIAALTLGGA